MLFQKYNFFKGSVKTAQDEHEKAAVPAPCRTESAVQRGGSVAGLPRARQSSV